MARKKIHESDSARAVAWARANPERKRAYMKSYRLNKKDQVIKTHRKSQLAKYGMTEEEYLHLSQLQNWCCAICGRLQIPLHVDHDHTTGKVRGLLCGQCNVGIGMLGDTPEALQAALEYLRNASR